MFLERDLMRRLSKRIIVKAKLTYKYDNKTC